MEQINFAALLNYKEDEAGIPIEVELIYGGKSITVTAKLDTGAAVCLFSYEDGLELGVPIEHGTPQRLGGLTGTLDAYGHEVTIQIAGIALQSLVYFAKYPGLQRNLLGRQGWLRNLKLGLIDYDNRLYLSPYEVA